MADFYSDNGKVTGYYMNKSYQYNDGHNNGNVVAILNNNDHTRDQSFTYDQLNRLASAGNAGTDCTVKLADGNTKFWGDNYGYDAWGNLLSKTVTKCSAENINLSVSALGNNQLSGYGYDAAGNMTSNATTNQSYSYDPENRITGAAGFLYTYDADGNRVEKSSGTTGTLYWYMTPGIVAESDLSGNLQSEYVFFGGERVARIDLPGNTVHHFLSDHLHSTTLLVGATGAIENESEYYPWGGERQFSNTVANHYKFTGHERDSETNLDYFGARYYSNALGRFTSPDSKTPSLKHLINPQKWNKYAYTLNNPLRYIDPDGLEEMDIQLRALIQARSVSDPLGRSFAGDNRGFTTSQNVTSRTSITVRIETDASKRPGNPIISVTQPGTAGQTRQVDANGNVIKTGTATTGLPTVTGTRDANGNAVLNFQENTKNPLEPQSVTPGISADLNVMVPQNGSSVTAVGTISGTPSFELNVSTPDGGTDVNIPLQTEPSGMSFGLGLFQTNSILNFTPLPPPPPPCARDKGKSCQ